MIPRYFWTLVIWLGLALLAPCAESDETAQADANRLQLDNSTRDRCLAILRAGLRSDEFWPAMHAAEALSLAGYGAEVQQHLRPRPPTETDDQKRCGLARELARAGDLAQTQVLLDILANENPYGHVHACESLYKIWQIGDGQLLRKAMQPDASALPAKPLMAAAALARWGNPEAMQLLRNTLSHPVGETARIAAWIVARTGGPADYPALEAGAARFDDPLTKAYFQHALATLGHAGGQAALLKNLRDPDSAVRIYACEFAPDARLVTAREDLIRLLDDEVLDVRVRAAQALLMLADPPPLDRRAGWTRDLFPATPANPRYSEGSIAVLQDGRLLYATTEFIGSESDFATARIVSVESADEGRSWSQPRVLQENVGKKNVMSATLRRLGPPGSFQGPLGFFYLVKNAFNDLRVYLRISNDEGASFGEPILVTNAAGYHVLNNDRVTVLSSGRIIVPVSSTEDVEKVNHFTCSCFFSDDGGRTWQRSQNAVDYAQRGAMEPEVLELRDGRLLMHIRTQLGHIAVSHSTDGGMTWSPAENWQVQGPESPATLRRIPSTGDLLLIWNDTFEPGKGHGGKRRPLTAAVSRDEGQTWSIKKNLETDATQTYAYTSVAFHRGRALLSYYVGDDQTGRISSRFRSVPISWFYEPETRP